MWKVLGRDRHLIKTIVGRGYLLVLDGPMAEVDIDIPHRTSSPANRALTWFEPDGAPQITPR